MNRKFFLLLFFSLCYLVQLFSQNYDANAVSITIPNGVTIIEDYQFLEFTNLQTVKIPNSVKKIGEHAFDGCTKLENIELPDGITEIGMYAFSGCKSLKSIKIPSKVTKIDHGSFFDCESLETVVLPKNLKEIASGPGTFGAFNACCSLFHIESPVAKIVGDFLLLNGEMCCILRQREKMYVVPYGCSEIRPIFPDMMSLGVYSTVFIPSTVKKIDNSAFFVSPLKFIELPASVKEIGESAFKGCLLSYIVLPKSIERIGKNAFSDCESLEEAVIETDALIDYEQIFAESKIKKLVLSKTANVTNIPDYVKIIKK